MANVTEQPETIVNRLQLMKLLYRYKGLLEWELSFLAESPHETISLALPVAPGAMTVKNAATKADAADDSGKKADQEKGGGEPEPSAEDLLRNERLESACRYRIPTIETYTDLVDAATPYVRALADA